MAVFSSKVGHRYSVDGVVAPVSIHCFLSFSNPDGFLYLSLESVLSQLSDRCLLLAYHVVSVHDMVGNCRFVWLPRDGRLSCGPSEGF